MHRPCPPHRLCSDDALWALDGLASGSAATARDSLATLADICASKRGRLALRSGQLAADVLAAAGGAVGWWWWWCVWGVCVNVLGGSVCDVPCPCCAALRCGLACPPRAAAAAAGVPAAAWQCSGGAALLALGCCGQSNHRFRSITPMCLHRSSQHHDQSADSPTLWLRTACASDVKNMPSLAPPPPPMQAPSRCPPTPCRPWVWPPCCSASASPTPTPRCWGGRRWRQLPRSCYR